MSIYIFMAGLGGIALDGIDLSRENITVPQAEVNEGLSSSVFDVVTPATITSQGSEHKVYYTVPPPTHLITLYIAGSGCYYTVEAVV